MEIFSYQRSFRPHFFRLNGKIRLIVIVISGNVSRDRRVFRTLVHIHGSRNTERIIRETLCYTDTGPFGILVRICKTLRARIEAVQVITVITAGRKVHTRRESPVRICLRVLRVCPVQLEVLRQAIIGKSLVAQTGNQIGGIETARKLIPFPDKKNEPTVPKNLSYRFHRSRPGPYNRSTQNNTRRRADRNHANFHPRKWA